MKKLLLLCFILTGITLSSNPQLQAFDELVETMNKHYFDSTYGGIDWKKVTSETREKIKNSNNIRERYKLITEMLGKMKHSHMSFTPPAPYGVKKQKKRVVRLGFGFPKHIDFRLLKVEGKWVITYVKENGSSWKQGLRPGFVVDKIENVETGKLVPDEMAEMYMESILMYFPKRAITFTGKDQSGNDAVKAIRLGNNAYKTMNFGHIRGIPNKLEKRILPGNIGYVRFNIFLFPIVKDVKAAINEFKAKKCKGVIIDIRDNPGGIATMSCAVALEFCSKTYSLGTQKSRESTLKFPVFAQANPFKGKVVLLINKNSLSTSELLSLGMQTNKSAVLVGQKTGGQALPSLIIRLKDGSTFQYPVADFKDPKGTPVEGIGVKPDHEVKLTLDSLRKGVDLQLKKAVEIINKENK